MDEHDMQMRAEAKFETKKELYQALLHTRDEGTGISLEEVAHEIKDAFCKYEVESLINELTKN